MNSCTNYPMINHQPMKRVRFQSIDTASPVGNLTINKPVKTNTYQQSAFCHQCGTIRYGASIFDGCKNCLIPKPPPDMPICKSQLLSKSAPSILKSRPSSRPTEATGNRITNEIEKHLNMNGYFKEPREQTPRENLDSPVSARKDSNGSSNGVKIKLGHNKLSDTVDPRKCYKCHSKFVDGEVAVSADQIHKNARWHTKCFVCKVCNKLLSDLLYFHLNKEIYCQTHFNELMHYKITCAACEFPIKSNEYIFAENKLWHLDHFICWNCDKSLGGQKYLVNQSKPYCTHCYDQLFSKKCNTCKNVISYDLVRLTYDNLDWHSDPNCFKCSCCNINLLDRHFLLKRNHLFCSIDCKKKVMGSAPKTRPPK